MTVGNLSVCFGPTLLRPEEETVASIMDLKFYNVVVEILIENYETIFKSKPEVNDLLHSEIKQLSTAPTSTALLNHGRTNTSPLESMRHTSVSHPQPRYKNSHMPLNVHYVRISYSYTHTQVHY